MVRVRLTVAVLFVGFVALVISCSDETVIPPDSTSGPEPPHWVHVSKTAVDGITLVWDDVTDNEAGFRIERSANGTKRVLSTVGRKRQGTLSTHSRLSQLCALF